MALLGFSVSDVAILLFVLIPGYIVFTLVSRIGKTDIGEDRLDKIIVISAAGMFCNAILITAYSLFIRKNITRDLVDIEAYSLFQVAQAYIALIVIASFIGALSGVVVDKIYLRASQRTKDDVWDTAFNFHNKDTSQEPVEVIVITDNGLKVQGYALSRGTSDNMHDILVEYPTIREYGNNSINDSEIGRRVYIASERISHVFFMDDS